MKFKIIANNDGKCGFKAVKFQCRRKMGPEHAVPNNQTNFLILRKSSKPEVQVLSSTAKKKKKKQIEKIVSQLVKRNWVVLFQAIFLQINTKKKKN